MSIVSLKRQANDAFNWWRLIEAGRRAAWRVGISSEDAEDCAVEFAMKTMDKPERVLREDLPAAQSEAWLRRCARNWCLNYHRRLRSRVHESLDAPEMPEQSGSGHPHDTCFYYAQHQEFNHLLQSELRRLPQRQQELFSRCCLGGESAADVTHKGSGQTPQQVYLILHRVRKSLRGRLEERGITAEALFTEN